MKKDYNKATTSDIPMDDSFTPEIKETKPKTTSSTTTKAKINAIGKKAKTQIAKKAVSTKEKTKGLRTKLNSSSVEMSDLEKLNEDNIRTYSYRSRRNKVIIALLSVVLAITIAVVSIFAIVGRLKTNCNMILHGNVNASYIIDDMEIDEFRTPSSLQGNRILKINIEINIRSGGTYNVKFIPLCYQKGVLMGNTLIYEPNYALFEEGGDGYYYSKSPISGNQVISLCGGIILDYYYETSLNADNFKLDFHTYFEKV